MKLIKAGKVYLGTCGYCGAEFEYYYGDKGKGTDCNKAYVGISEVVCPFCKHATYVHDDRLKSGI